MTMKIFKGCFYYRNNGSLETEYLTVESTSKKKATDYFKSIAKEKGWRFVNLED